MAAAASIASMTGSRVDSATKHVRTCRVATDYIEQWLKQDLRKLQSNKLLYAVQKDDIFIGCGPPIFPDQTSCFALKKAYAVGLHTLHDSNEHVRLVITLLTMIPKNNHEYLEHVSLIKGMIDNSPSVELKNNVKQTPSFYFEGVALTTGYPHGHIGDTALSVLTGGMITMRNGPFAMNAGDLVTWVWGFELDFLTARQNDLVLINGEKQVEYENAIRSSNLDKLLDLFKGDNTNDVDAHNKDIEKRRNAFFAQQKNDYNSKNKSNARMHVPYIIPLPMNYTYMLRKRMLGRCLAYGRPFDMTDILLSRQGL